MTVFFDRLRLPPEPSSARAARLFVSEVLGAPDEVADIAILLVSELASNAIQHAGTDFEICVAIDDRQVRVDVSDADPRLPSLKNYDSQSINGRGLHMIAATAHRWGFEASATGGKVVWFELQRPSGA